METINVMANSEVLENTLETAANAKLDLAPVVESKTFTKSLIAVGAGVGIIGAGVGIYILIKAIKARHDATKEAEIEGKGDESDISDDSTAID